jgi:hypothetical protein
MANLLIAASCKPRSALPPAVDAALTAARRHEPVMAGAQQPWMIVSRVAAFDHSELGPGTSLLEELRMRYRYQIKHSSFLVQQDHRSPAARSRGAGAPGPDRSRTRATSRCIRIRPRVSPTDAARACEATSTTIGVSHASSTRSIRGWISSRPTNTNARARISLITRHEFSFQSGLDYKLQAQCSIRMRSISRARAGARF